MIKRVIASVLILSCVCFADISFADSSVKNPDQIYEATINEYESIKALANKSAEELRLYGYSNEDICNIKNYKESFKQHIINLSKLSGETLCKLGYSDIQIYTIQNFNGDESQMVLASASLTFDAWDSNFSVISDGRTQGKIVYSWSWSGTPMVMFKDEVAAGYSGWETISNASNIYYYNINTGDYSSDGTATYSHDGNIETNGNGHKWSVKKNDIYYAKRGNGSMTLRSLEYCQKNLIARVSYGHQQLLTTISFSVSQSGADFSIDFNVGAVEERTKRVTKYFS